MIEFSPMWDLVPIHYRRELHDYVNHGVKPCPYIILLLSDEILGALKITKTEDARRFGDILKFINYCLPPNSHGSSTKVLEWIKLGGLNGLKRKKTKK